MKVNIDRSELKPVFSREQKRQLARKFKMTVAQIEQLFQTTIDYHFDTYTEGSKVKLKYDEIMAKASEHSELYTQFIEEHKDDIMTVEYDPQYGPSPSIVCLAEDKGETKWTFHISELELVELAPSPEASPDEEQPSNEKSPSNEERPSNEESPSN